MSEVVAAEGSNDSFFASMRTLKALLHSTSPEKDKSQQPPLSPPQRSAVSDVAWKVLEAKLAAADEAQRAARQTLQEEQSRNKAEARAQQDVIQDLEGQIRDVQGALRREMEQRVSVERAHEASARELRAKLKEAQQQRLLLENKAREEEAHHAAKLQAAQAAVEQERELRLAKEKELAELKTKQEKNVGTTTTAAPLLKTEQTSPPSTPNRFIKSVVKKEPAVSSPSNVPLLLDKIAQLQRQNERLCRTQQEEHQKHQQEMDRILQQKQSALSQRDSLAAKLAGQQKQGVAAVLEPDHPQLLAQQGAGQQQQQQQLAVHPPGKTQEETATTMKPPPPPQHENETGIELVEQKYKAIVEDLEKQLAEARAAVFAVANPSDDEEVMGDLTASQIQQELNRRPNTTCSAVDSNKGGDDDDEEENAVAFFLQTTIQRLESELEAALAQNADLSRMERLAQEKLNRTEMDLESAIAELTQNRAREQGQLMLAAAAAGGGYHDHRERYDDRDDDDGEDNDDSADEESTESEEQSDDRSGGSVEGEDEEGGEGEEFDEPEVIVLDDDDDDDAEEEEPTPKKQKIYEDV